MKINQFIQKKIFLYMTLVGFCSTAVAQDRPEEGGGGGGGGTYTDCNNLGTAITNGRHYARTEPFTGPFGQTIVDPGLSVHGGVLPANTGVLAGSSNRVQTDPTGSTINLFSGITTKASCVSTASITTPNSGGSSRTFYDTGSGMTVPPAAAGGSYYPGNSFDGHSAYGCVGPTSTSGGLSNYDFTFTLNFSNSTQVDGIYWEDLGRSSGGTSPSFEVYVNGAQVSNSINMVTTTPFHAGAVNPNSGASALILDHYAMSFTGMNLTGSNTIMLRAIGIPGTLGGGSAPVLGDLAILGCCTPVPEPSSAMLLVSGASMVLLRRKR